MSVLERILATKRIEVAGLAGSAKRELAARARDMEAPRGLQASLKRAQRPAVIAEFKRASPSKGPIRPDADPARVARLYADAGAAALSVLTDREYFGGSLADLESARSAVHLPVLRKDFTIDPVQVLEARAHGADAILLIVAALDDARLRELGEAAAELGMDSLVEVHTRQELDRALAARPSLIGINNRDLATFVTDVEVTRALLPHAGGVPVVSESGLDSPETLAALSKDGVSAFLIGEALMRHGDPGAALRHLRGAD